MSDKLFCKLIFLFINTNLIFYFNAAAVAPTAPDVGSIPRLPQLYQDRLPVVDDPRRQLPRRNRGNKSVIY